MLRQAVAAPPLRESARLGTEEDRPVGDLVGAPFEHRREHVAEQALRQLLARAEPARSPAFDQRSEIAIVEAGECHSHAGVAGERLISSLRRRFAPASA
jgi:hypothetical protein